MVWHETVTAWFLGAVVLFAMGCGSAGPEGRDPGGPDSVPDTAEAGTDRVEEAPLSDAPAGPDEAEPREAGPGDDLADVGPVDRGAQGDVLETSPDEDAPDDVAADETAGEPADPTLDSDGDGLPDGQEHALGTDPHHPDSDRDGIPDGAELQDGTDPADPSSAIAWHPEWNTHPRLFFDPDDLETLRARSEAADGPWAMLWARITSQAAQGPLPYPDGPYDITISAQWGAVAEAAAFVGVVRQDPDATAKALAVLAMPSPDPSGLSPMSNYQLLESEALVSFCTAWDYVAANPLAPPDALAAARAGLLHRLDTFRWMCHEGPSSWLLMLSRNNHPMKVFGALGLCALALNDQANAALDLSEAMTGLDFLLNLYQGTPDGGYAEGWNYLQYGSESFLPFFAAYHRYAKGEPFPYFGVPALQIESPHAGQVHWIPDFAANETTRAIYRRALWSVRPDGLTPETDDANPAPLNGAILAWLHEDPAFLWAWFKPSLSWFSGRLHTATLALYDGAPPPADPGMDLEDAVHDAGFAVFRESWKPDAVYLVLQGEHGPVRRHGEGHEHADELSLMLRAYGQPLILDPGYINWANHDLVRYATDHNTILVDGKGAPVSEVLDSLVGADAFLTPMRSAGDLTWVAVKTAYEGTAFQRRVVRVAGRYFVVEDRILGDGQPHAYSLLWNGYGGGDVPDSAFSLLDDGARWEGPDAWVEVHSVPVSGGSIVLSHDLQEHVSTWGQWALHERLVATRVMDDPAGFLTVLVPGRAGEEAPAASTTLFQEGVAGVAWMAGDLAYVALSNQTQTDVTIFGWYQALSVPQGLTVQVVRLQGGQFHSVLETHHLPPVEPEGR